MQNMGQERQRRDQFELMLERSEQMLFQRIQEGDREAWQTVFDIHEPLVETIASVYVNNDMALDDLIQKGCLGLAAAIDQFTFDMGRRFHVYAKRKIRARVIREAQRKLRMPLLYNDDPSFDEESVADEREDMRMYIDIQDAFDALQPIERDVMMMRVGLGEALLADTFKDIASVIGRTKGGAHAIMWRAMEKLRDMHLED